MPMRLFLSCITFLLCGLSLLAQPVNNRQVRVRVITENKLALQDATVALLSSDSSVVKSSATDALGLVHFSQLDPGNYLIRVRSLGFRDHFSGILNLVTQHEITDTIVLIPDHMLLQDVTVTAKKPLVQFLPDKTVINVEAGITNAGATVMDVLEKSPGITIGRDGNISMKGKPQVMVLIDGKQTQLNGAELPGLPGRHECITGGCDRINRKSRGKI